LILKWVNGTGRRHRIGVGETKDDAGVLTIMWLLLGPPGAGKSMLARRLTTILPAMTLAEAMETTRIHRVASRTGDRTACVTDYPAAV
jgi:predicted ATPase with chaperone activity